MLKQQSMDITSKVMPKKERFMLARPRVIQANRDLSEITPDLSCSLWLLSVRGLHLLTL